MTARNTPCRSRTWTKHLGEKKNFQRNRRWVDKTVTGLQKMLTLPNLKNNMEVENELWADLSQYCYFPSLNKTIKYWFCEMEKHKMVIIRQEARGAGNSNSEHSVPHLGWKGVRGRWEKVRIPAPITLFLTLGLKGEGGRSGNSDSKRSYSLPWGWRG